MFWLKVLKINLNRFCMIVLEYDMNNNIINENDYNLNCVCDNFVYFFIFRCIIKVCFYMKLILYVMC